MKSRDEAAGAVRPKLGDRRVSGDSGARLPYISPAVTWNSAIAEFYGCCGQDRQGHWRREVGYVMQLHRDWIQRRPDSNLTTGLRYSPLALVNTLRRYGIGLHAAL